MRRFRRSLFGGAIWKEIVDGRGGAEVRRWSSSRSSSKGVGPVKESCESYVRALSCPSARLGDDSRCSVSHIHVLVERPGCGQYGFGVMPMADDGRRSHRKARRCASSGEWIYYKQVQRVWCGPSARQRPSNGGGTTL